MSAALYVKCPECGAEIEHPAIRLASGAYDVAEYPHACADCGEFGVGSSQLASLGAQTDRAIRDGKVYE